MTKSKPERAQGTVELKAAESSRGRILSAAVKEFAKRGFAGARVQSIADEASINKQLIYHHFGSKEALYIEALERTYQEFRDQELKLNLGALSPEAAIGELIGFTFAYVNTHREFVEMLVNENTQYAKYLKQSHVTKSVRVPLLDLLNSVLNRGVTEGIFRCGVDAVKLYTSIASLCFFYSSNVHTMSVFLDRDLQSEQELRSNRDHIVDLILAFLTLRAKPGPA